MSAPQDDALRAAIEAVIDPTFEKPLGQLDAVRALSRDGERLSITVRLATPAEEIKTRVKDAIAAAVEAHGIAFVEVEWDVQVPTRDTTSEDAIPDVKNVILVMSGKGGVGKSTVSANLALALRRAGTRVGLLDADIYGPSVPTMLGVMGPPASRDGKRIVPLERFGLKLMSVGFMLEDPTQAIVWRGPRLHGALQQFISGVDWGPLDYLVIDMPPGTGDVALTIAQKARVTGVVMVTTPQQVALDDVLKGVTMCKSLELPMLGIVENMSYFEDPAGNRHALFGEGGGEKVAEFSGAPLLAQIPIEQTVREWGDKGTPVVQAAPASNAGQVFADLADKLAERIAREHFERAGGEKAPKAKNSPRLKIVR